MKPTEFLKVNDPVCLQEEKAKLTMTATMMVNANVEYLDNGDGFEYGNWKIEPFTAFKVTMDDNTVIILTTPEDFERFGITFFEQKEIELDPCDFE